MKHNREVSPRISAFGKALLCLPILLTPLAGHAEDRTAAVVTTTTPIWGDWHDAPDYPGIKIRVICRTYDPTSDVAEWNFQFQNTYPKRVHLVFQQETPDTPGDPPNFVVADGHDLKPNEESPVFADHLKGSCEARKLIYLGVVSIDNKKSIPQPVIDAPDANLTVASSTSAAQSPILKTVPKTAETTVQAAGPAAAPAQPDSPVQLATRPTLKKSPPPTPVPVTSAQVVGRWRCTFEENQAFVHYFKLDDDGFGYGFLGLTGWSMQHNVLQWNDHDGQLKFTGTFLDAKTLDGTVSIDEDFDYLPNHKHSDNVHCTAQ